MEHPLSNARVYHPTFNIIKSRLDYMPVELDSVLGGNGPVRV